MNPSDAEYKFKRADRELDSIKLLADQLFEADQMDAARHSALLKDLGTAHKHLAMAYTQWERRHMSHRKFASEYDI